MSEYGRDESAPTPGGVFRGYFVGVRCIINNPFEAKWQAVSSRRADLSCPCIRARHTFVKRWGTFTIRLKHIYVMFATCSLSVCYIFAV
ncbi:hypothetical protein [uncultured Prevotella sp.]|uniref:hypothetical protein n=1 Tax=uncultured Prevotella sp. TaxID=159272 RepID=UPI0025844227|nr:hypothetical protein [uncultured Prevotella sp.]